MVLNELSSGDELPGALEALASAFGADQEQPTAVDRLTIDDVRAFVAEHVARLLDENPGLLMSILYRIDVAEPKVRHVLESAPPGEIVERLTALIIERQLEKVRLRRRFSQREDD